jgi:3-phosphoshikimate 1-carboxyvinyltransferase
LFSRLFFCSTSFLYLSIANLSENSIQGDKMIAKILKQQDPFPTVSAANIPDLVPILAVYFATRNGAVFTDIARLRLKESDRVATVSNMLRNLGIRVESDENTMTVFPGEFTGGIVDAAGDHRIAMATAIAATVAQGPVTILAAQCVAKSYPTFWQEYARLGGNYEQYIR